MGNLINPIYEIKDNASAINILSYCPLYRRFQKSVIT